MGGSNINSVFYASSYHPIQSGSIDGTDVLPHDNAIYRALLCSSAGLYDPFGDPKATGDPYSTVFVGRLSHLTTEETLLKVMSKYGQVKKLRLVRDIVTGASRGYAFVEYESEREMRRAHKNAHHSIIDDCKIIVDYNRQQLMPGWIPRRLGGGLGGKKESGQLRFGGRERPFQAPLKPIPYDELERLGIPPPPEGKYMPRFQVPSPPRKKDKEGRSSRRNYMDRDYEERHHRRSSVDREESSGDDISLEREERYSKRTSMELDDCYQSRSSTEKREHHSWRSYMESGHRSRKRSSKDRDGRSHKRRRHDSHQRDKR